MRLDISQIGESELAKIREVALQKGDVEFCFSAVTREIEETVQQVLITFLAAAEQTHLFSLLSYCTLELLSNANKANAKRIYFKEQKLNIEDEKEYSDGMANFKNALSENKKHFMSAMATTLENSVLKLSLSVTEDILTVCVSNNTKITPFEYQRIQDKLGMAKQYKNMEEALSCVDQTEGSGLGLIITVLMLKELGLDETNLKFEINDDETVVSVVLPVMNPMDAIQPLDNLEPLDALEPLEALDPIDTIEPIDGLEPLDDLEEI